MFALIPKQLRIGGHDVNRDHNAALQFQIGDNFFNPALSKSRNFYTLLNYISIKVTESKGFTKLKSKFSIDYVEARKPFPQ